MEHSRAVDSRRQFDQKSTLQTSASGDSDDVVVTDLDENDDNEIIFGEKATSLSETENGLTHNEFRESQEVLRILNCFQNFGDGSQFWILVSR